jgi:hypothetical protein
MHPLALRVEGSESKEVQASTVLKGPRLRARPVIKGVGAKALSSEGGAQRKKGWDGTWQITCEEPNPGMPQPSTWCTRTRPQAE